jgi:hypothetical protein
MKRKCSDCKKLKQIRYFHKNKASRDGSGYANVCAKCFRKRNRTRVPAKRHLQYLKHKRRQLDRDLFKHYGITRDQYNEMLAKQDNLCAICGKHASDSHKGLHVDHCHETKKVRGLLCSACNIGIGMLKHNGTILRKAMEYLGQ